MSTTTWPAPGGNSGRAADVLGRLERRQAGGMGLLTAAAGGEGTQRVMPTPALRRAGNEALERLYYALALTLNER